MKKILALVLLTTLLTMNSLYSQENKSKESSSAKIESYVYNYALSYFSDLRAVIYIYRSELKTYPKDYKDIMNFVKRYNLDFYQNESDTIEYFSKEDGSSIITFSLTSKDNYKHRLSDTMTIKKVSGIMNIGKPMMEGSSITSVYGEIISGELELPSGNKIFLQPNKSLIYMTRVDLDTIKRIARLK